MYKPPKYLYKPGLHIYVCGLYSYFGGLYSYIVQRFLLWVVGHWLCNVRVTLILKYFLLQFPLNELYLKNIYVYILKYFFLGLYCFI